MMVDDYFTFTLNNDCGVRGCKYKVSTTRQGVLEATIEKADLIIIWEPIRVRVVVHFVCGYLM
jgi:hypothetical protein